MSWKFEKKKAEPYLDFQQIFSWVPDIKIFEKLLGNSKVQPRLRLTGLEVREVL